MSNTSNACPLDYAAAAEVEARLEAEMNAASRAMDAWKAHRGPTGLTPDHVRATPEWKAAKAALDLAFARLRSFNAVYTRRFKLEIARARDARRAFKEESKG